MEKEISEIHSKIKELFPEAVSVSIFVNCEGINVTPNYRTDLTGCSMRNINGEWVKGAK